MASSFVLHLDTLSRDWRVYEDLQVAVDAAPSIVLVAVGNNPAAVEPHSLNMQVAVYASLNLRGAVDERPMVWS